MGERSRSRSPGRRPDRERSDRERPRKSGGGGGFRWKDKRRDGDSRHDTDERRLNRGYRDREERARSPRRDRDTYRPEDRNKDSDRDRRRPEGDERDGRDNKKKEKKEKKHAVPQSSEPMIIVHVNDRLGSKASIPCLASDPIKLFKAQVAARIGREPHEILLKRQGERPFKDFLTLADYSISSGSQLDLEVGTGE
ncbi:ubiquitin-related domain-containing protein [Aspergillus novoparasiticus]|uniref:Ubiquitin-like modifier HUB1 n=1 Tax=Aspergillus novoparasiticus TaxID=986946 RepID=A0A5N6EB63_9EURO|nr:ubiquitin-related domain-containing protein [Aspergillus novoparasiticus]